MRVHVLCTGKSCAVWRAWHLTLKRRTWGTCGSLLVWRCALVSLRAWRSAACLRERRWGTPFHSFQQMNFINHIKDCQTSDRWHWRLLKENSAQPNCDLFLLIADRKCRGRWGLCLWLGRHCVSYPRCSDRRKPGGTYQSGRDLPSEERSEQSLLSTYRYLTWYVGHELSFLCLAFRE